MLLSTMKKIIGGTAALAAAVVSAYCVRDTFQYFSHCDQVDDVIHSLEELLKSQGKCPLTHQLVFRGDDADFASLEKIQFATIATKLYSAEIIVFEKIENKEKEEFYWKCSSKPLF